MIRRALLFFALACAPSPALAGDISHVARPGDTPLALSKVYHVSVAAILARNKGLDPCRIKVGDVILVPDPAAPGAPAAGVAPKAEPQAGRNAATKAALLPDEEPSGLRYVVIPGDNPAAIAERFGIPLDVLSRANPGIDPKNLAVGRVLSIPPAEACPPPALTVARPGDKNTGAPLITDFQ